MASKHPNLLHQNLLEQSAFDFGVFVDSQDASEGDLISYAYDLVRSRRALGKRFNIFLFLTLGLLYLNWQSWSSEISIHLVFLEVTGLYLAQEAVHFLLAIAFIFFATTFISMMLLNAMIYIAFYRANVFEPEFLAARIDATHLFSDVLRIRNIGYRSTSSHKGFIAKYNFLVVGFYGLVILLVTITSVILMFEQLQSMAIGYATLVDSLATAIILATTGTVFAMLLKYEFEIKSDDEKQAD